MDTDRQGKLEKLTAAIGHRFGDMKLLAEALTHRSYINEARDASLRDNQRFEFLGDAVLGLVIGGRLLNLFPGSSEGELSRSRASLVDENTLAVLAERLDLGSYLLLGRGEEKTGGRKKRSILADTFEALAAAIYLDGGLPAIEAFVDRTFGQLLSECLPGVVDRDGKTRLQELSQARFGAAPRYVLESVTGPDHAQLFTVTVCIGGEVVGTGEGRSKKEAEQDAACSALKRLEHVEA